MNEDSIQNKNAKHKFDVLYKIWLGSMFRNITFPPLSDDDVKEIRTLLDEADEEVAQ